MESTFNARIPDLKTKLQQRGYKQAEIGNYISDVQCQDRTSELIPKRKTSDQRLTLTVKYSDKVSEIKQIIRETGEGLHQNPRLKRIFPHTPRIVYKKNPASLRNKLVRAKLPPEDQPGNTSQADQTVVRSQEPTHQVVVESQGRPSLASPSEFYEYKHPPTSKQLNVYPFTLFPKKKRMKPCCRKNCNLCKRLRHSSNFVKSRVNSRMFQVQPHGPPMTCHTKRVVYLIQCKQCHKQYVGQTTQQLNQRVNAHLSTIRSRTYHSMSWHFNNDHSLDYAYSDPT